jgi:hypothetical protein
MAATRTNIHATAKDTRRACPAADPPDAAVRTLRSPASSALIEGDGSRPSGHSKQRRSRAGSRPATVAEDPLDGAPVVVSIEHTKPGSPLDEQLRREQIRALLDLLADHVRRCQDDQSTNGPAVLPTPRARHRRT